MECFIYESPFGPISCQICQKGVHMLTFGTKNQTLLISWLDSYFKNPQDLVKTQPIQCNCHTKAESFRAKVYSVLQKNVPFGATASYADLARMCDNPRACRAVGSAMSNNHVPLLVPCHRVIKSDGSCGRFSADQGTSLKEKLIKFENDMKSSLSLNVSNPILKLSLGFMTY